MSTTKIAGKVAIGMFLILSIVVFGSLLYVGFCCVNTEIVVLETALEDGDGLSMGEEVTYRDYPVGDADESIRRGDIEYVPSEDSDKVESIRRGYIEYVPMRMPREPPVIREPGLGDRVDPIFGSTFIPPSTG